MAFREFASPAISRRALLRGGATLGAGAALSGLPLASWAYASPSETWSNVSSLIDNYVGSGKLANMVALMGRGQQAPNVVAEGPLTVGRPGEADMDSLYRIYSMTKPITGMAAMKLIDEGKLGLDQPLHDILPRFSNMTVQKTYDGSLTDVEPAKQPITIRHLLTHTAGIGYTIIQKGPIKDAYEEAGLVAGQVTKLPLGAMFGRGTAVPSLELFADRLAEMPLVSQPGSKWIYSMSLDLLGRVIEVVSGQTFDTYLSENIFQPCGMTSTYFRVPASEADRLTTNYGVLAGALIPLDPARNSIYLDSPPFPFGGAGLVSSPRDYDRFLRMLLGYGEIDGNRVLSEAAVRLGTSNLLPETASTKGTFLGNNGFGAGGRVGIGEQAGTFGWGGAAGTVGFADLRRGIRASLYTQYMPAQAYPLTREFTDAVVADVTGAA